MTKLKLSEDHPYFLGRVCTTCKTFKPASDYRLERDKRAVNGIAMRSKCSVCHEERKYKAFLKLRYNITHDDYLALEAKQKGCCAICKSSFSNNSRTNRLFVDHCHSSGKVRGLLCSKCNHALGLFNDDINLLSKAISYLSEKDK